MALICISLFWIVCFSPLFYFQITYVLEFEVSLLYAAYIWIMQGFLIHCINLCLLIDVFRSFTFKIIIDMLKLSLSIYLHFYFLFAFSGSHSVSLFFPCSVELKCF